MDIVQLTSETMKDLRHKRDIIMQSMIDSQEGTLLVLSSAYAGEDRRIHHASYAVFTIFYELWERFNMDSWSYTFDAEGFMFYIRLDNDAREVKNILIHYEDYHPLGFAIDSDVFDKDTQWTRAKMDLPTRVDAYSKRPLSTILDEVNTEKKYKDNFKKQIESEIVRGDRETILSNILVYGFVAAFAKPLGFGMYGPNYKGSNDQMNFERFIHLVRTYKNAVKKITSQNSKRINDVVALQQQIEESINRAVLNQQSYHFAVYVTSITLFAFINSKGYADISKQVKKLAVESEALGVFKDEPGRFAIALTGFKELFSNTVPYLQKSGSIESSLLYLLSRTKDQSILLHNGEQNLLKVQFLAKNLMAKEDKWLEMNKFCASSYIYPHDTTNLMIVVAMLDLMQRNYLKIKMLFDVEEQ